MATKKKKDPDRIPQWLMALICCVLGLAVVIGIVAFIVGMGYFEEGFALDVIPTNLEQVDPPVEEEFYADAEPEETDEPEQEESDGTCTALELSQEEIVLDKENSKFFLSAVPYPADCTEEVLFTSTDEQVAFVNENGMVTAIGPGETDIIATCGDITAVCSVVCVFDADPAEEETETEQETQTEDEPEALPAPTVKPDDFTLFYPGEEAYLTVSNVPEGTAVSYVSSDASVVSVTDGGKVTAVGNGQATITVTVGDVKLTSIARCNLSSTTEGDGGAAAESYTGPFTLNYTDITFQYNGEKLTLKLTDANGKTVSGLNWVTGNSAVCIVSGGTVTAMGRGETKVSATYNGTTYSCIIRTAF